MERLEDVVERLECGFILVDRLSESNFSSRFRTYINEDDFQANSRDLSEFYFVTPILQHD